MTKLIIIGVLTLAVLYYCLNLRTILSALASILFFLALIWLPPLLAGSNEGLQILIFLGIVLIIYMSVGKDIFKSKLLNFLMGIALFFAICVNFFQFCRRGW